MIIQDLEHLEVVTESSVIGGAASSFQQSCTDIEVFDLGYGVFLAANCLKEDGSSNYTEFELQDIHNRNGVLAY